MINTPIARHSMPTSRVLSSTPFPVIARTWAHAHAAPIAVAYVATPDTTTTDATVVVNPWLGGGTCGDDGISASFAATPFGIAPKRNAPGRLEGMT